MFLCDASGELRGGEGGEGEGASVCCVVVLATYMYCSMPLHPRKEKEEGSRGEFLASLPALRQ